MVDGRPIARIVPEQVGRREQVQKAIEAIRGLGEEIGTMSVEEILTARHQGHKI